MQLTSTFSRQTKSGLDVDTIKFKPVSSVFAKYVIKIRLLSWLFLGLIPYFPRFFAFDFIHFQKYNDHDSMLQINTLKSWSGEKFKIYPSKGLTSRLKKKVHYLRKKNQKISKYTGNK